MDAEEPAFIGGGSREEPCGNGVGSGDGGGLGAWGPEAADHGEGEIAFPASEHVPLEGIAIALADAETGEEGEDTVATDQGAFMLRQLRDEQVVCSLLALVRGGGMGGAFLGQVALTRHEMLLTSTQGDGYIRPYSRGTA